MNDEEEIEEDEDELEDMDDLSISDEPTDKDIARMKEHKGNDDY